MIANPKLNGGWTLIDGVAMNAEHPDTFAIPPVEHRTGLESGDLCKVGLTHEAEGGERFWVQIEGRRDDGAYVGRVSNNLIYPHGLDFGDEIVFRPEHVLASY